MGGFTSTAPILAGGLRKVPTFVHESNAIPGKANRLNGRLANTVLLGFEECRHYFPKARCEVTGTPIRATLLSAPPRTEALAAFGLDRLRKTMLVMGGSQGATGINEAVLGVLPQLAESGVQVIHLTGPGADEAMRAAYEKAGVPAYVAPFCHDMGSAYSAADFAIARSGAASLAELAQAGLPSVLIPYPFAAENHQFHNAEIFSKRGAAILISQSNLTPASLLKALRWFLDDPQAIPTMSAAATKLAPQPRRRARGRRHAFPASCLNGHRPNPRGHPEQQLEPRPSHRRRRLRHERPRRAACSRSGTRSAAATK